jgi:hypothetical protein
MTAGTVCGAAVLVASACRISVSSEESRTLFRDTNLLFSSIINLMRSEYDIAIILLNNFTFLFLPQKNQKIDLYFPRKIVFQKMSSAIVFPKDFKTSNVTISPVKVMDSGAKQAYLNYEGRALMMQVSALSVPYGMSVFDKAGPVKYSVDLSLKGYDGDNVKVQQIYNAFNSLDELMIDMGVKLSKQWFKSELSRDIIKAFYTPSVRFSKDAEGNVKPYPPTLKIQLKQREGKFETAVYDEKKRPMTDIPLEDVLVKGAVISSLIQCTGVWFAGSKFGLSWKAIQIKADHLPESIRGFAFREEDEVAAAAAKAASAATAPSSSSNHFESLAEDDEADGADGEVLVQPAVAAVAAVAAPPDDDDEADIVEPIVVPKKATTVTAAKVVKKVIAKK